MVISLQELFDQLKIYIDHPIHCILLNELSDELFLCATKFYHKAYENAVFYSKSQLHDNQRKIYDDLLNEAKSIYQTICTFEDSILIFEGNIFL